MNKKLLKVVVLILSCLILIGAAVAVTAAADESDPKPTVSIYKRNLAYEGAIQVIYLVDAQNLPEGAEIGVDFNGKFKKHAQTATMEGKLYYAVFSDGIVADEYRKDLIATPVIRLDGEVIAEGESQNFTPYDYAMLRFNGNYTKGQFDLYKALLDYGAAVQAVVSTPEELAATGWIDEYYRLTLNGEAAYKRGVNFDGKVSTDRFDKDGKIFDRWTDGEGKTVAGFTSVNIKPGDTVLNANYVVPDKSLLTFDGITVLPPSATYNKHNSSSTSYATVGNNVLSFGKTNTQSDGSSIKFATVAEYATKYVYEMDFNWTGSNMKKTEWVYKICLWSAAGEMVNAAFVNRGNYYEIGGVNCDYNTWHKLRLEVYVNSNGTVGTYLYIDGNKTTPGAQAAISGILNNKPNPKDYRAISAGIQMRDSTYHDATEANLLIDNAMIYTVGEAATFDVALDANGGNAPTAAEVTMGAGYELPTPTRDGYVFGGWYNGNTLVNQRGRWSVFGTGAVKLTAAWSEGKSVTLQPIYGTLADGAANTALVADSLNYTLPTPTLDGCEFAGWLYGDTLVTPTGTWDYDIPEGAVLTDVWYNTATTKISDKVGDVNTSLKLSGYDKTVIDETGTRYVLSIKFIYQGISSFTAASGNGTVASPLIPCTGLRPHYIRFYGDKNGKSTIGYGNSGSHCSSVAGNLVDANGNAVAYSNGVLFPEYIDTDGNPTIDMNNIYFSQFKFFGVTFDIGVEYDLVMTVKMDGDIPTFVITATDSYGAVQSKEITMANDIDNVEYFLWERRTNANAGNPGGSGGGYPKTNFSFKNISFTKKVIADVNNITLDPHYGALPEGVSAEQEFVNNGYYALPTPILAGYDFRGWYIGDTLIPSEGKWTYGDDVTLVAQWRGYSEQTYSDSTGSSRDFYLDGYTETMVEPSGTKFIFTTQYTYLGLSSFTVADGKVTAQANTNNVFAYMGFFNKTTGDRTEYHQLTISSSAKWVNSEGKVVVDDKNMLLDEYKNLAATDIFYSKVTWGGLTFEIGKTYDLTIELTLGDIVVDAGGNVSAPAPTSKLTAVCGDSVQTSPKFGSSSGGNYKNYNCQGFSFYWRGTSAVGVTSFTAKQSFKNTKFTAIRDYEDVKYTLNTDMGTLPDGIPNEFITLKGLDYTLPTPTISEEGYTFNGWYVDGKLVPISGKWAYGYDVDLVARWDKVENKSYNAVGKVTKTGWSNVAKYQTAASNSVVESVGTRYVLAFKYTYNGLSAFTLAEDGKVTGNAGDKKNYGFVRAYNIVTQADSNIVHASDVKPTGKYVNASGAPVTGTDGYLLKDSGITASTQIFYSQLTWMGLTFDIGVTYDVTFDVELRGVGTAPLFIAKAVDDKGNVQTSTMIADGKDDLELKTTVIGSFAFFSRNEGTYSLTQTFGAASCKIYRPCDETTVTLDANGGTLPEGSAASYLGLPGMKIQLPTPTREGYNFVGWNDGSAFVSSPYTIGNVTSLKAVWETVKVYDELANHENVKAGSWSTKGYVLPDYDANKSYLPGSRFEMNFTFTYHGASPTSGSGTEEDPYTNKESGGTSHAAFFGMMGINALADNNRICFSELSYGGGTTEEDGVVYWNKAYWGGFTFERGKSYNLQLIYTVGEVTYVDEKAPTVSGDSAILNVLDDEGNIISSQKFTAHSMNKASTPDNIGGFGFYFRYPECVGSLEFSMTGSVLKIYDIAADVTAEQ